MGLNKLLLRYVIWTLLREYYGYVGLVLYPTNKLIHVYYSASPNAKCILVISCYYFIQIFLSLLNNFHFHEILKLYIVDFSGKLIIGMTSRYFS